MRTIAAILNIIFLGTVIAQIHHAGFPAPYESDRFLVLFSLIAPTVTLVCFAMEGISNWFVIRLFKGERHL